MKKAIILVLMVLAAFAFVFAADEPPVVYDDINFAFQPTLARYDAMGQSGIALPTRLDSFFTNPANLGVKRGFAVSVPSFSFTMYNIQPMVSDPDAMENFNALIAGDSDAAVPFATKYLENLGSGRNMISKIDIGVALKLGVIGAGTNVQIKLHTLNEGTSVASQNVIPEVNVAQTVGLGLKIIDTDVFSFSAGASISAVYKAYFKGIGGSKILDLIGGDSDPDKVLLWDTPVMGGYAIPFNLGITFGLFEDQLTLSATANNLNGKFYMKSYTGAGYLVNSYFEGTIEVPDDAPVARDSVDFEVETPWTLNFGAAFAPKMNAIQPVITADLIDMFELIKSFNQESFRASDLLLHLNLGAELGLFQIVKARVGVNRGFLSVGAGVWLPFAELDASYGWQEFGEELGDHPVDSFTVKFSIGYDK
ncbi:MAG: hypothetical protein J5599_00835 [Spirochaetales bacterium]|nr:hypothetical protein [Spirochaetales bacterium]